MGLANMKKYLELRYGNYMKLPFIEQRKAAVHAKVWDAKNDYRIYIQEEENK